MLLIDDDLGFVFWLGRALDAAAFSALPARTVADAALLVLQFDLAVDVLVINLALGGGADFIAALHRSQKDVKVVGILDEAGQPVHVPGVNAALPRPTSLDEASKNEWIQCIKRILMQSSTQSSPI